VPEHARAARAAAAFVTEAPASLSALARAKPAVPEMPLLKGLFSSRNLAGSESTPARPVGGVARAPALVKVALLGERGVGKTSLMARYVEGTFDETQLHTQGVNFMEKSVTLGGQEVTFSIWDIGGGTDSESMLPLVCNDAAAVLLMFDLGRPETLDSIREWHRKARALNSCFVPFLVGCKYDRGLETPGQLERLGDLARRLAAAINAPLVFCAPSIPINVANIFKVILVRLFGLAPAVPIYSAPGQPLCIDCERLAGGGLLASEPDREGGDSGAAGPSVAHAAAAPGPASPPRVTERVNTSNTAASGGSSVTFGV
jgi:GTP-binding protein of the ras superfamily involved in termination of M-phase